MVFPLYPIIPACSFDFPVFRFTSNLQYKLSNDQTNNQTVPFCYEFKIPKYLIELLMCYFIKDAFKNNLRSQQAFPLFMPMLKSNLNEPLSQSLRSYNFFRESCTFIYQLGTDLRKEERRLRDFSAVILTVTFSPHANLRASLLSC